MRLLAMHGCTDDVQCRLWSCVGTCCLCALSQARAEEAAREKVAASLLAAKATEAAVEAEAAAAVATGATCIYLGYPPGTTYG
jgi:hypothetical protein